MYQSTKGKLFRQNQVMQSSSIANLFNKYSDCFYWSTSYYMGIKTSKTSLLFIFSRRHLDQTTVVESFVDNTNTKKDDCQTTWLKVTLKVCVQLFIDEVMIIYAVSVLLTSKTISGEVTWKKLPTTRKPNM